VPPEMAVHGWECSGGFKELFSHILSHNIGPVGWRNSKPTVQTALDSVPAMLALQDVRLPRRYLEAIPLAHMGLGKELRTLSAHADKQQLLLRALTTIMRYLHRQHVHQLGNNGVFAAESQIQ